MELIPIIKASLGIFTILTSITLAVSYVIYKFKDRNRAKPYDDIKPYVENEIKHPVKKEALEQKSLKNKKFRIVNDSEPVPVRAAAVNELRKMSMPVEEKEELFIRPERRNSENEVFNIYNLYSNNDARPMHKLKHGEFVTETGVYFK